MQKHLTSFLVFTLLFIQIVCRGQGQELPENFDYGAIEKGIYHNKFFKVKIPFDTTWFVQNKEQIERLSKVGRELVAGDNKELQAAVKVSEVNSANLLTIFKFEVGSPVEFNPSFVVIVENLVNVPGIKRGKDYLFHAKRLLQQSQVTYSFEQDFFERQIGSRLFDIMEARLTLRNKAITQDYISTIINGFCFSFILSYTNEQEKNELYSILLKVTM